MLLLLAGCMSALCGCWNNTTVTYIPHENSDTRNVEQTLSYEQVQSLEQQRNLARTETLKNYFENWRGTRYRRGGLSHNGIDCSGFALLTYKELFGKELPRTVREQAQKGKLVKKEMLQPGDLVFFKTGHFQKHVGIYLEDDLFIHASRSHGVMLSSLDNSYWQERYWKAKRLQLLSREERPPLLELAESASAQ